MIADFTSIHATTRANAIKKAGGEVITVGKGGEIEPISPLSWIKALRAVQTDAFYVHFAASWGGWALTYLNRSEPIIVTVMGADIYLEEQLIHSRLARWATKQLLLVAEVVTSKTEDIQARLLKLGVGRNKILNLPWGINPEIFHPNKRSEFRERLGISDNATLVLSPRILRRFYNHHLVLEAASELEAPDDFFFVFCTLDADPVYRRELEQKAIELGLDNRVIFVKPLSQEKLADAYRDSDFVVSLAPSDGFPQTVLEASSCGCICVIGDLPRLRAYIDDTEALFVPFTGNAIMQAMTKVQAEPKFAKVLKLRAQEISKLFGSINENAKQLLQHIPVRRYRSASLSQRLGCFAILVAVQLKCSLNNAFK